MSQEDKPITDADMDLFTLWAVYGVMVKTQEYLSTNDESGQADFGHALYIVQDMIDAKERLDEGTGHTSLKSELVIVGDENTTFSADQVKHIAESLNEVHGQASVKVVHPDVGHEPEPDTVDD